MHDAQPMNWGAEALWEQLEPLLPGLSVEVLAQCDSTNTRLLERARGAALEDTGAPGRRQGDALPCLLVAELQTQGRGRQGKHWHASRGASLTFSLSLPLAPKDWSGLSLAVGLAVAEALDPAAGAAPPRIGLKWPNDLMLMGAPGAGPHPAQPPAGPGQVAAPHVPAGHDGSARKLGGILIETVAVGTRRMAVVGIGLNIQALPVHDASWGHAWLQELDPALNAPQALATLAGPLVRALLAFEHEGFAPLRERFARRDALYGRAVSTTLAEAPDGVADGVDADGALWLRRGHQRLRVSSGELSIRQATP
ncbi:MAG: biotin--[acetyl-CoA-carboxylase] ligase [Burkholderiales bacterium]|nr:biotin--[acetyl-CoA-carboxylase] ligase [Burkholderiales bacterium]